MIRIRHAQGTATLNLSDTPDLATLQSSIQSLTSLPPHLQQLRLGFPPRLLPTTLDGSTPLSDAQLDLKAGDQVNVSKQLGGPPSLAPAVNSVPSTPQAAAPPRTTPPTLAPKQRSLLQQQPITHPDTPTSSSSTALLPQTPTSGFASSSTFFSSSARRQGASTSKSSGGVQDGQVHVDVEGSALTLKVVADDNSCLFNAVALLMLMRTGPEAAQELREVSASLLLSQPDTYSEVVLGMDPSKYASKMISPKAWGGAIELAVLAQHFHTELHAVDVKSGVVLRFGEGNGFAERAWLVYSGIHYDALALLPTPDAPLEFGTMRFPVLPEGVPDSLEDSVMTLVGELRNRHYYTDTATFSLKCNVCGVRLEGEKQAQNHAQATSHTDFVEA